MRRKKGPFLFSLSLGILDLATENSFLDPGTTGYHWVFSVTVLVCFLGADLNACEVPMSSSRTAHSGQMPV